MRRAADDIVRRVLAGTAVSAADMPTACEAFRELRAVVASEFEAARPSPSPDILTASHSLLSWHRARCGRLRALSALITVPRGAVASEAFLLGRSGVADVHRAVATVEEQRRRGGGGDSVSHPPSADHGPRWRLDGDEFVGWLEQSRPTSDATPPPSQPLPLPDLVAHVDSLHAYHEGQPAATANVTARLQQNEPQLAATLRRQSLHPFHRVLGVPHSGAAAPARALARWLRQSRGSLLQGRQAAAAAAEQQGADPNEVGEAHAGAPLVAVTCGQWDGGFAASLLLSDGGVGRTAGAQALLMTDGDTDALLNAEESVQRWVAADVAHRDAAARPAQRQGKKARPFVHSACTSDGAFLPPRTFCPPVDLAVVSVPPPRLGAQLLPDPLLSPEDVGARCGEVTTNGLLGAANTRAVRQLRRVTGGHVALLLHDWGVASDEPPLSFHESDAGAHRAVLAKLAPTLAERADVEIAHAECFVQPHVADEVSRALDAASHRRCGTLRLPPGADPFHFGVPRDGAQRLPLHLDPPLVAAAQAAARAAVSYLFVLRVQPGAADVGADRFVDARSTSAADSDASPQSGRRHAVSPSAIAFGRWGQWDATQAGVHWRDTAEYEHYTPKAGVIGSEHLGSRDSVSMCGDGVTGLWGDGMSGASLSGVWCAAEDHDLMAERRAAAAAVRAAEERGDAGAADAIRRSLDRTGRPLHRPAAAAGDALSTRPATGAAADTAAGRSPLRDPNAPDAPAGLHSLFSESAKASRRRRAGRVAVKSDAAVERYLDQRVLPRMRKVLAVGDDINRIPVPKRAKPF